MATSTTSTVPAVRAALCDALADELPDGVTVWRAWPGPDAAREMVVLGNVTGTSTIPNMKAGRRQRQESYDIETQFWVFGAAGSKPTNVAPVEDRAWTLVGCLENVLADDPQIDGTQTIQWGQVGGFSQQVAAFEASWAIEIEVTVHVEARLL